jgi:hypothetical protein
MCVNIGGDLHFDLYIGDNRSRTQPLMSHNCIVFGDDLFFYIRTFCTVVEMVAKYCILDSKLTTQILGYVSTFHFTSCLLLNFFLKPAYFFNPRFSLMPQCLASMISSTIISSIFFPSPPSPPPPCLN